MGCCASNQAAGGGLPKIERKPFKPTKVPDVDEFFQKVDEPANTICDCSDALSDGSDSINSLAELEELKDKLGEAGQLKEMLRIIFQDLKKNKIEPSFDVASDFSSIELTFEAVPDGYLGKAVEAIQTLFEGIKTLLAAGPDLIAQFKELGETAAGFKDNIQDMAKSAGLSGMDLVNCGRNLAANTKQLAGIPNDIKNLIEAAKELITTIKDVMGGGGEDANV